MIKKITIAGALLLGTSVMHAQHGDGYDRIQSVRNITISADTDRAGGNEGISLLARNSTLAWFTPDNIAHKIRTFFEATSTFQSSAHFNSTTHFNGISYFNNEAKFGQLVDFRNGYKVTSGSVDFNIGTFSSKSSASFIAHVDRNGNDPNVDTFKVLYGTNATKILDVGINKTQLSSSEFESTNNGSFIVNVDVNNNSQVDKFKVLYGNEKREVLSAGKDDVIISTKLVTKNDISTKNIAAEDIVANRIVLNVGSFPDYVFADEYRLMPLEEVASYIKKNKHLPNMPSEAEVVAKGMNVAQINTILVEKVEELTLHTIKQEEKINMLLKELQAIKKAVETTKK